MSNINDFTNDKEPPENTVDYLHVKNALEKLKSYEFIEENEELRIHQEIISGVCWEEYLKVVFDEREYSEDEEDMRIYFLLDINEYNTFWCKRSDITEALDYVYGKLNDAENLTPEGYLKMNENFKKEFNKDIKDFYYSKLDRKIELENAEETRGNFRKQWKEWEERKTTEEGGTEEKKQ